MKTTPNSSNSHINTQLDAVLHFICKMDEEMVDQVLIDESLDAEFDKREFMTQLSNTFGYFREIGDRKLIQINGVCGGFKCDNYKQPGYTFVGDRSKNYINLIVDVEGEKVSGIFECNKMRNRIDKKQLQLQIYIDHPGSLF